MTTTEGQSKRPFGGVWTDELIIDLSPCSSAVSSQISEGDGTNSDETVIYSDDEEEVYSSPSDASHGNRQDSTEASKLYISIIQDMVYKICEMYYCSCVSPADIAAEELALLNNLHDNAVTIGDVEALIPAMYYSKRVTNKLATNIGLFHSRGRITEEELEKMLVHILVHDVYSYPQSDFAYAEHNYPLFKFTKTQIARFEYEQDVRKARVTSYKKRRQEERQEKATQLERQHNEDLEAQRRRRTIPFRYREPSSFLPEGASSLADVITEIDGMDWFWAMRVQRVAHAAGTTTLINEHKAADRLAARDPVGSGSWSQTRLGDGPMDSFKEVAWNWRKGKPRVKLPMRDADTREVSVSTDIASYEETKDSKLSVQSRSTRDVLFPVIVVRLPKK